MAIRTGIAPMELLRTPAPIFAVMVEHLFPRANIRTGEAAWQELASTVSD